jgi:hypothetical protein
VGIVNHADKCRMHLKLSDPILNHNPSSLNSKKVKTLGFTITDKIRTQTLAEFSPKLWAEASKQSILTRSMLLKLYAEIRLKLENEA